MGDYYEKKDLEDFANIGEYAPEMGKRYFGYYSEVMKEGKLSEREKALIALAVATTQKCPYCIDAYTDRCLSLGVSREEMMEAVHVGAAMAAGVVPGSRGADEEDRKEKGNVRWTLQMQRHRSKRRSRAG